MAEVLKPFDQGIFLFLGDGPFPPPRESFLPNSWPSLPTQRPFLPALAGQLFDETVAQLGIVET